MHRVTICPLPEGSLTECTDPHLPRPLVSPLRGQAGRLLWSLHLGNMKRSQEYLAQEGTHRLCHLPRLPAGLLTPQIYLLHLQAASPLGTRLRLLLPLTLILYQRGLSCPLSANRSPEHQLSNPS